MVLLLLKILIFSIFWDNFALYASYLKINWNEENILKSGKASKDQYFLIPLWITRIWHQIYGGKVYSHVSSYTEWLLSWFLTYLVLLTSWDHSNAHSNTYEQHRTNWVTPTISDIWTTNMSEHISDYWTGYSSGQFGHFLELADFFVFRLLWPSWATFPQARGV